MQEKWRWTEIDHQQDDLEVVPWRHQLQIQQRLTISFQLPRRVHRPRRANQVS